MVVYEKLANSIKSRKSYIEFDQILGMQTEKLIKYLAQKPLFSLQIDIFCSKLSYLKSTKMYDSIFQQI